MNVLSISGLKGCLSFAMASNSEGLFRNYKYIKYNTYLILLLSVFLQAGSLEVLFG